MYVMVKWLPNAKFWIFKDQIIDILTYNFIHNPTHKHLTPKYQNIHIWTCLAVF